MKSKIILIFALLSFYTQAQAPNHEYTYDAHGNRVFRGLMLKKSPNDTGGTGVDAQYTQDTLQLNTELQVFPNPTQQFVNVKSLGKELVLKELRILNINGAKVWSAKNLQGDQVVDFSAYAAGRYILWLHLGNDEGIKRIPIIKQ